ncbi:unnamed protein product [Gordionus sp. m RMFG-2023]
MALTPSTHTSAHVIPINSPICSICQINESAIWRKIKNYGIICNSCYILQYLDKLSNNLAQDIAKTSSDSTNVRKSQRVKNMQQRVLYPNALNKGKGRRSIFFKQNSTIKTSSVLNNIKTSNFLYNQGIFYQIGDIVALLGMTNKTYYAQIKGFMTDAYMNKSALIHWLIPIEELTYNEKFDPYKFKLAYEEITPRNMNYMEFVCRLPPNYFTSSSHKTLDLHNLTSAGYINTTIQNVSKYSYNNATIKSSENEIFLGI